MTDKATEVSKKWITKILHEMLRKVKITYRSQSAASGFKQKINNPISKITLAAMDMSGRVRMKRHESLNKDCGGLD